MDVSVSSRRRGGVGARGGSTTSTVVVAGSVWESRMKSDEFKGGIKVFNGNGNGNGEDNSEEGGGRLKRSPVSVGKRKTWKSDTSDGRAKAEPCKEIGISSDGVKRSPPIQARKVKAEATTPTANHARKLRSDQASKDASESSCEGAERSLRKSKSDSIKTVNNQNVKNGDSNLVQLRKTKSASSDHPPPPVLDESRNGINGGGIESISDENGIKDDDSDEICRDFGVCQEKIISSTDNVSSEPKCSPELSVLIDGDTEVVLNEEAEEEREEDEEEAMDEDIQIEMEKESFDVKEISVPEPKIVKESENKKVVNELEKKVVVKEPEKKVVSVNEQEKKMVMKEPENKKAVNQSEPKKLLSSHRRFQQSNERPVSIPSLSVKHSPPVKRHSTIYQNFSKVNSNSKEYHSFPQTQSKLQSLVDLIMWRDISRSAFVFGIGTFIITSSSYAKDVNVSFISVMSYLGLVYLAVIFLYRSLICRGVIDVDDTNYVLGEEEATWVLRLILPYLNELLSKLRALFSGDPGTTMKLAVLLFVLARSGNSITIWKMAKFGFFGVFTVPKICSSYSAQLTAYANFWVRRFRDAWDSCSHKKAVALGIFGLVWNLSSVVARVWAEHKHDTPSLQDKQKQPRVT
ncbi:reticulon-like protein B21 [Senna tora]|uniref:Reticulon-like protein n=1 Tax=Senna tora TaxID=362788 RepID=A0A834X653_9FABA|nr:reticulon-like protein B21 [Senna tora]